MTPTNSDFHLVMYLPIWAPTKPSGSGERRFYYSPKNRRLGADCSKLESEYRLLLEYDPDVVHYCEQPITVHVFVDGRWHKSRLDFWVWRKPYRETFVEVKYASELKDPNSPAHFQIRIQKIALANAGKEHQVVTDEEICANPVLNNSLRTLFAEFDKHYPVSIEQAKLLMPGILAVVANNPGQTIDGVMGERSHTVTVEVYRLALFELIRTHELDAAIERVALSPRSVLSLGKKGARS